MPIDLTVDTTIDARGLRCPLPILRAKKALATMQSGQILKVFATDPGAQFDFTEFARQTGNDLLDTQLQNDGSFMFLMRRR